MKKILMFLALFLLSVMFVSADFTILDTDVKVAIDQNSVTDAKIKIKNDGANTANFSFDTSNLDLSDNDNDKIKLSFLNANDVVAGETREVTIRITSDSGIDFESYGGSIVASDGTNTKSFTINIEVVPIICDFGIVGNELKIRVNEPDAGDDITPGQKIKIDVDVENVGNDDMDVQLTALLFSDDRRVESGSSQTQNIDNGDEDDISFDLVVPVDNEDLGENDDVFLVIKAYDDDGEDENCVQEIVRLNIDLKNDALAILDNSRFAPDVVACGQVANALINVVNLGKNDQDVYVEVSNNGLKINERSNTVELQEFDSKDDNEASFSIPVRIPNDVRPGRYDFSVSARGDSTDSATFRLEVSACESFEEKATFKEGAKIRLMQETLTVISGEERTLAVRITNEEVGPVIYNVELVNTDDFADGPSSKTVTIAGNQSLTVFLPFYVRDDAKAGRYSGTVNLRNPLGHLASETVFFDVVESLEVKNNEINPAMGILLNTLYIIGGLIVLFAILIGVKLAARKK
jgi:uncharacterized membrane protein